VLVADDDRVTLRFLRSLFEREGWQVLVAEDGDHALQLAREHRPDVVVSDLVMPYRDGFDVLRAFKRDPELRSIPVILLTMKDREEDVVRGLEAGAEDYVVKPFHARELVARIRKRLRPPAPPGRSNPPERSL